jgi:uncharacterized SAM-binding protein YcdF (DUF218 family)
VHRLAYRLVRIMAITLLVWMGGFLAFMGYVPLHVEDDQTPTQAIVVLTGGRDRLKTGFFLLAEQRADVIFISGVHPGETIKTLLKTPEVSAIVSKQQQEWFASRTLLGHTATNTQENALETAAWVKKYHINSLRLVTAAYHMPRSLLELTHLLPETLIIPHPVFASQKGRWSWNGRVFFLLFSEYHKFLWAFLRMPWSELSS